MAIMIQENVEIFKTEGEMRFYRFLESVAKLDNSFLVIYTPDVRSKEPDFILYSDMGRDYYFLMKDTNISQLTFKQTVKSEVGYLPTRNH